MPADEPSAEAALATLGLPKGADRDTIWRTYRRLARASHPDVSGAPDAAGQFQELTRAYRRAVASAEAPPAERGIQISVTHRDPRPHAARTARAELEDVFTGAVSRPWRDTASFLDDGSWVVAGPVLISPCQARASEDPEVRPG